MKWETAMQKVWEKINERNKKRINNLFYYMKCGCAFYATKLHAQHIHITEHSHKTYAYTWREWDPFSPDMDMLFVHFVFFSFFSLWISSSLQTFNSRPHSFHSFIQLIHSSVLFHSRRRNALLIYRAVHTMFTICLYIVYIKCINLNLSPSLSLSLQ